MLSTLTVDRAQFIALLAEAARIQRDKILGNVAERDLDDVEPGRGEHNPAAALGFEPLSSESAQAKALATAIAQLAPEEIVELHALMRIGQGHLAAREWGRGVDEAARSGDAALTATLLDDADLHDHLMKGLFEIAALGDGGNRRGRRA